MVTNYLPVDKATKRSKSIGVADICVLTDVECTHKDQANEAEEPEEGSNSLGSNRQYYHELSPRSNME